MLPAAGASSRRTRGRFWRALVPGLFLGSLGIAGCASTVGEASPHAAAYAQNEAAGLYQADVRTVLAAKDDRASRSALACIILLHHGLQVRDDELARLRSRTAVSTTLGGRSLRPPPLPGGESGGDPEATCAAAEASRNPAVAAIGRRYRQRASAELGFEAVRQARATAIVDEVAFLLERGEDNLAFRAYHALKLSGPIGAAAERIALVEAEHGPRFALEAAFEARPDVRVLRRREADLVEAATRPSSRGSWGSHASADLADVRTLLREAHDAFVASHHARSP